MTPTTDLIPLEEMYPGMVNSPETILIAAVSETDTEIPLQSIAGWIDPPFVVVLGGGLPNAETVKVIDKTGNTLIVERGHQGIAQSWEEGTTAAVNFTEGMYRALIKNIISTKEGANIALQEIDRLNVNLNRQAPLVPPGVISGLTRFSAESNTNTPVTLVGGALHTAFVVTKNADYYFDAESRVLEIHNWDSLDAIPVAYRGAQVTYIKGFSDDIMYGLGENSNFYKFTFDNEARHVVIEEIPLIAGGGKPNLLDNADFRGANTNPLLSTVINQRTLNEYRGVVYTIDRWRTLAQSGDATNSRTVINNGFITRERTAIGGTLMWGQHLEFPQQLCGKTVTLSALVRARGTTGNLRLEVNNTNHANTSIPQSDNFKLIYFTTTIPNNATQISPMIQSGATSLVGSIDIAAVKLEEGSVSTLHLDPMPNAEQRALNLLNCQRFFLRLDGTWYSALAPNGTRGQVNLDYPQRMRATPIVVNSVFATGSATISPRLNMAWIFNNSASANNFILTRLDLSADL